MGRTPFDDFDDADVLTPQDIADRLRIDARSVRSQASALRRLYVPGARDRSG